MSAHEITPARLRDLADNAFDTEFRDLQAALRAAAATLAAREALHGKDIGAQRTTRSVAIAVCVALGLDLPRHIDAAEQAINAELDIVGLDYDTAIVVQPRALAAEIAAALGGRDDAQTE